MDCLRVGDRFPSLEVRVTEGGTLRIPEQLRDQYAVLVFYRGHF